MRRAIAAVGLVAALAAFSPALAAPGRDAIGISPTSQLLKASAGQTLESNVTIINDGDNTLQYKLYAEDFKVTNEDYQKQFQLGSTNHLDPATWLQLPAGKRTLPPHQEDVVSYKITVPNDAGPGSHHAVIFAENIPEAVNATGVRQIKRVGALVFLSVGGQLRESGQLLSYKVSLLQSNRPLKATLEVQNNGNDHFQASGEMVLSSYKGHPIQKVAYSGVVVPATTRRFTVQMSPNASVGIYKVSGSLTYLGHTHQLASHWVILAPVLWLALVVLAVILIVSPIILKAIRLLKHSKHKN